MRKGRDGEKKMEWKMENNGGNSAHYVVASRLPFSDRLQCRRSCQKYADVTIFVITAVMSNLVATAIGPVVTTKKIVILRPSYFRRHSVSMTLYHLVTEHF